jgi:1,2-diacylglycerol 3-beta-glucosyltransferase
MMAVILLSAFGAFLSGYVIYQLALFAANAWIPDPPDFLPAEIRRFNILVPAHNEEIHLPRLLESLRSQEYPNQRYRVTVIADNCSDGTAAAGRAFDVDVLERVDTVNRGKGYAMQWALERIAIDSFDAVVILDGDSLVNPEFLKHLNLQMERGDRVIQSYNGVANPGASWFTRLMDISETMANDIVHPGKRKLGLSCHLLGNGMCFAVDVLKTNRWNAFSVGEDWEYYAKLALNGISIGYNRHARQLHQESEGLKQASWQRMRWSGGRFQVLRIFGPSLIMRGLRTRSVTCLDACLPLVFPNPSLGINLTLLGLAGAAVYWRFTGSALIFCWFSLLALLQMLMFGVGVLHTKDRMASAAALGLAPIFLVWKMGIDVLSFCGVGTKEWKPSERRVS